MLCLVHPRTRLALWLQGTLLTRAQLATNPNPQIPFRGAALQPLAHQFVCITRMTPSQVEDPTLALDRSCGCPIPGSVPGQAGRGLEQPGLVAGVPARGRGLGLDGL